MVQDEEQKHAVGQISPSYTVGGADQYWGIQMNTNKTTHEFRLLEHELTMPQKLTAASTND